MTLAGINNADTGFRDAGVRELAGYAKGSREIIRPYHHAVDRVVGKQLAYRLNPGNGLDLKEDGRTLIPSLLVPAEVSAVPPGPCDAVTAPTGGPILAPFSSSL